MIQFLALLAASDMLGTAMDIENALPLPTRLIAVTLGFAIFCVIAAKRDPGFVQFKRTLGGMV